MLIITKQQIDSFIQELGKKFEVFDCREDILPPKQHLFPPVEQTFKTETKSGKVFNGESPKSFILFGLSLRDLEAITYLDEIMEKPQKDFYYFRRRERAILIGLTDEKFDVPPGGDLILRKLTKEKYEAVVVTEKGKKLIGGLGKKFFTETKERGLKTVVSENKTMPELRELLLDPELLRDAVEWSWKGYSRVWNRLAGECLGCGICTYVCPLCYCFSVEDKVDLSGKSCSRCCKWDACTLPGFAKIAGGHNFHKSIKERYYNWFYHKFVRGYLEFGKSQCVTCGRCRKYCPARIDIERVLIDIVKVYKQKG